MEFIDSHCHLSELSAQDLDATLTRAREAHVSTLIAIGAGYGFADNLKTLEIATAHANIYCALAMHPHDAKDVTAENSATLEKLIRENSKVCAVGEVGLDYHYMHSDKDLQLKVLRQFAQLARRVQKPLVIHDRDCAFDCVDLLREEKAQEMGGVVHCFTGSKELAQRYLDLGFYVSFSGIITFKKADELREVVKMMPMDRLLIETDSPFLAPVPHRGKKNEPAFVQLVAEEVARIKNASVQEVSEMTCKNTKKLFRIQETF